MPAPQCNAQRCRRQRREGVCSSISRTQDGPRAWGLLKCLLMVPQATRQVLSVAVYLGITTAAVAEHLADRFAARIPVLLATPPPAAALKYPASCHHPGWVAAQIQELQKQHSAGPKQQSGFRRYRYTADSIADVVATLEDAKSCGDVAMLLLLDVESAFDGLPHTVVKATMDGSHKQGAPRCAVYVRRERLQAEECADMQAVAARQCGRADELCDQLERTRATGAGVFHGVVPTTSQPAWYAAVVRGGMPVRKVNGAGGLSPGTVVPTGGAADSVIRRDHAHMFLTPLVPTATAADNLSAAMKNTVDLVK
ncbi:hypothetical protein HPB49_013817 [Dermacentor silvarum]|uniref:Uncharacterized protein n=1 Tax=Dermacentor silvarum TaxID=543639 RepID=A0ACB8CFI4_DERSI|nr:hypothetical protein HPB49_013817 [Dermacentor silvarum]